ncbi:mitochondrial matrix Mmp37 family protein [Cavenderia fasciculata]|uniref:Phosphatidate cytidylyltransferase, mitochondrial n=1 Tax=Cavenderia fasciculata TaxID=261658 RepID=F4Q0F6_CACFS|nr:mitochondrial matrix Mmp37 family protein [Cavenderia fasciculata]EGG18307.1 mitochondrial matrix Mmp37 family protein [Cavenderia fasciculata]|eukprot:XP_004357130.1 mitochondrial matrix Mmp37 family protein [Cavenderia fasciculata]
MSATSTLTTIRSISIAQRSSVVSLVKASTTTTTTTTTSTRQPWCSKLQSIRSYSTDTSTQQTLTSTNTNRNEDINNKIKMIMEQFPKIKYGFAYGSGVIAQKGYDVQDKQIQQQQRQQQPTTEELSPMIDMVFAVDNANDWHKENLERNWSHYSFLAYGGPKLISFVQRTSAKVYYNTLLSFNGVRYKYGVIEYKDLKSDLINWDSLYVSGRMMKPILNLPGLEEEEAIKEIEHFNRNANLCYAISCSLMMLPEQFTEYDFYHTICSISYMGDIRMKGGENPNKVHNLVVDNLVQFREIYQPIVKEHFSSIIQITFNNQTNQFDFKASHSQHDLFELTNHLPPIIRSYVLKTMRKSIRLLDPTTQQSTDSQQRVIQPNNIKEIISKIVGKSSFNQSFKGVFTAGFTKSLEYLKLKLISKKK